MSTFEFVSILLSIVISMAFTHLLGGIAQIIRNQTQKFPFLHFGWLVMMLLLCVDYWFSLWQLRSLESWSLAYVGFWLLLATALYLACWLLVPGEDVDLKSTDLDVWHIGSRRQYLGAYFIYVVLTTIANITTPTLVTANWAVLFNLVVIAVVWKWSNRLLQFIVLAVSYVTFGIYAMSFIPAV